MSMNMPSKGDYGPMPKVKTKRVVRAPRPAPKKKGGR